MAERAAARYLQKRFYRLFKVNFMTYYGELDLVMRRGRTLVFVEVKARQVGDERLPREAVDLRKQNNIIQASRLLMKAYHLEHLQPRYDVCEVYIENYEVKSIKHLANAFQLD